MMRKRARTALAMFSGAETAADSRLNVTRIASAGARVHRPVNRMQDVLHGGGVEIGARGDAAPIDEREVLRECLDRSGHAIAARAAQFDQIVGRGNGDQQASVVAQDTPEFGRIHPRRDRQDDRERAVGVGHEAVGIGDDPLASGIAPRGGIHGRNRDVDAMRIEAGLRGPGCRGRSRRRSRHRERRRSAIAAIISAMACSSGRSRRDRAIAAAPRRPPRCRPAASIAAPAAEAG